MNIRKNAGIVYISFLIILAITTLLALYNGGYHTEGGIIAGISIASAVSSLIPFLISMYLLKKYESGLKEKPHLKTWGLIIYFFCFPVKSFIIFSNVILLINGGNGWALG